MKSFLLSYFASSGKLCSRRSKELINYKEEIYTLTSNCISDNIQERFNWILYDIEDYPKCPICGNNSTKYDNGLRKRLGRYYPIHCSRKCRANDPITIQKMKKSTMDQFKILEILSEKDSKIFIKDYCYRHSNKGNLTKNFVNYKNIVNLVDKYCEKLPIKNSKNFIEKVFWWIFDIKEYQRFCSYCKNPLTFFSPNWKTGEGYLGRKYFCSHSCRQNHLVMYNPEKMNTKFGKNSYKKYIMPSGNIVKLQGFETKMMDILLEYYTENELVIGAKNVPKIKYFYIKNRIYIPDIYIPSENLLIEVKSLYTFENDKERNLIKQKAAIDNGFKHKLIIL